LAAWNGHAKLVQCLLAQGADVEAATYHTKCTALMLAANCGREDSARVLAAAGANLETKDAFGNTALMCASAKSHLNVMAVLLDAGADIHVKNNKDQTALSIAKMAERTEVIALLESVLEKQQLLKAVTSTTTKLRIMVCTFNAVVLMK